MTGPDGIESEVKIPVSGLDGVRADLLELGGERRHPPQRERNRVLDTGTRDLDAQGKLLRLRSVGDRHLLTLKGPPSFRGAVKERREIEIAIEDADQAAAIFSELGFGTVVRYEKDREDWLLRGVAVSLDHTPMGDFVELEGDPGRLGEVASALHLDLAAAVRSSYLGLWTEYRRAHPELELPRDMVFPS